MPERTGNRAGHSLKRLLENHNYSQGKFCSRGGFAKATVNQWSRETQMKAGALVDASRSVGELLGREALEAFLSDTLGLQVEISDRDFAVWQSSGPERVGYFADRLAVDMSVEAAV